MGKQILLVDGTKVSEDRGIDLRAGTNVTLSAADTQTGVPQVTIDATGGSGAPTDADYLVGTANGSLSAEIVVGTSPGGELGGTWASPTVDAIHSGSAHHAANHALVDTTGHTVSGLTTGHVLTATGATTYAFQAAGAASHPAYATHAKFGTD